MKELKHLHGELLKTQSCVAKAVNKLASGKERSGNFPKDLEAESIVNFKPKIFIREFVYNFTQFIPLIFIFEGYYGTRNRGFIGFERTALIQWTMYLSILATNIVYFLYRPKDINIFEIIILDLIFVFRTAVVATKYAYMSEPELHDFRFKRMSSKERGSKQILSSWAYIPDSIMEKQLLLASVRQKHDLHQYIFEVPERYQEIYEDKMLYDQKFSSWNIGLEMLKTANRSEKSSLSLISALLSVLHTFIPIIIRAAQGKLPFGGSTWDEWPQYVVSLVAIFPGWFLTYSNLAFLAIGVVDFRRRLYIATSLDMVLSHNVVRTETESDKKKKKKEVQKEQSAMELGDGHIKLISPLKDVIIDLSHPQNVSAWFVVRQVLLDFGKVFSRRINAFTAYFSIYIILLVLFLLVQVFVTTDQNAVVTVIVLYDTIIFAIMLVMMVMPAGKFNSVNRIHVFSMLGTKLESLKSSECENDPQRLALLRATSILIDTCVEYMRTYNLRNKAKIIGFEAGGQMAGAFLAVAGSGLAAGIRSIYNVITM